MSESDAALLQALHEEHGPALWSFCLRLTGHDRARAEDVVQETLLRAWRHSRGDDRDHDHVRAWLFTVARNIVVDEWRSRRVAPGGGAGGAAGAGERRRRPTSCCCPGWSPRRWPAQSDDHRAVLLECYYRGSRSPRRPSASGSRSAP